MGGRNDVTVGLCSREKIEASGGYRYREARRPALYRDIIGADHVSEQKVSWLENENR